VFVKDGDHLGVLLRRFGTRTAEVSAGAASHGRGCCDGIVSGSGDLVGR
jgi:hypothetical protein